MAVEATQATAPAGNPVLAAIRRASQVTGAKFSYLLATAKVESNLNPNAAARTSSAGGLFQFIDRTWIGTLKEAGPLLGYERYANAITKSPDGRYSISDPAMRREIMALRQDPTANALMAGVFTNSNAKHLSNRLGREATDGELYIAHFMGASGAARLIGMAEANPNVSAAEAFPTAARANRSIFFDKSGRARNLAEVAQNLSGRFNVARSRMPAADPVVAAAPVAFVGEPARVARAYQVADVAVQAAPSRAIPTIAPAVSAQAQQALRNEQTFHNPYRAGERRQPVSSAVTELWTGSGRSRQQEAARLAAMELEGRTRPASAQQAQQTQTQQTQPQGHAVAPASPQTQTVAAAHGQIEQLGLFQDMRPDVRSLFTAGVRG